ncbi:Crp/Fnr family transcriptional regulator [Synechococcus sp. MIT S1220]|uniref:Crp/Fnr family transcriptional regulator n=1 Tax=Synechococcus sp. MIT S1220 TaxID=3082549 RepID=UPI0039AE9DE1
MNILDTMRALASKGEVLELHEGEVLFRSGETGESMYGILEGTVRLSWTATNGKISHEDIVAGHVFGAGALVMEDHKRLGTATASEECRLIEMNREKFLFAMQEAPMFAIQLLASVDERLRDIKTAAN